MAPTMMVCALAGFLTAKLCSSTAARRQPCSDDPGRSADRAGGQFQAGKSVSGFRILPVLSGLIPAVAKPGDAAAGAFVRDCIPGRDRADAARECHQCGQSLFHNLWQVSMRCRRNSNSGVLWSYVADVQFVLLVIAAAWTALILRLRHRSGISQVAVVIAGKSGGESGFLHDPPCLHALLHHSRRHAFAVDSAVRP